MSDSPVSVRWEDAHPEGSVVVREALVPLVPWPEVPVWRKVQQRMTVLERFVLAASLRLEPLTPEDVEEVTSVPAWAARRIADRLLRLGYLRQTQDLRGYAPDRSRVERALGQQTVVERVPGKVGVLFLPDTEEVLVFDQVSDPGRRFPELHRVHPAANYPVPERLRDTRPEQLLAGFGTSLAPRSLGSEMGSADGQAGPPPGARCAAWRVRGLIDGGDPERLRLVAYGARTVRGKVRGNPEGDEIEIPLDLSGVSRLRTRWLELAESPFRSAVVGTLWQQLVRSDECSPPSPDRRDGHWYLPLDRTQAELLARAGRESGVRNLARPGGVVVCRECGDAAVEVPARFEPNEPAAEMYFAIDKAVGRLLAEDPLTDAAVRADADALCAQQQHTPADGWVEAIVGRLWQLGHYRHVYDMRAARDFAYA